MWFNEGTEVEIIENLMLIIHRDLGTRLTELGYGSLPVFAVMTDGEVDQFTYPIIALGVEEVSSKETLSGEYLEQQITVGAGMVFEDSTSLKEVRKKAKKYVRAVKRVIRGAAFEIVNGNERLDYVIDIDHRYRRPAKNDAGNHVQPVEMVIRFQFGET